MEDLMGALRGLKRDAFSFAKRVYKKNKKTVKVPKGHMTKYMGGYLKKGKQCLTPVALNPATQE